MAEISHRAVATALTLAILAAPLPAAASDHGSDHMVPDAVAAIGDPAMQDRIADNISAAVGVLMQIKVGPLADAVARVDPGSRAATIPPDATLGDLAGRGPDYPVRIGDDVRAGARVAGHTAAALAAYAPVLRDMARDLAAQWEAERDAARR